MSVTQKASSSGKQPQYYYQRCDPALFPNIPHELKTKFWIVWREAFDKPGKKYLKKPLNPLTLIGDGWPDPANQAHRATAVEVFGRNDDLRGIGFVLAKDDAFGFFDIDKCFVHGHLLPWVEEFIGVVNSYTEYSVGRGELAPPDDAPGIKIIARFKLNGAGCKFHYKDTLGIVHEIEVYDSGRFFAATGNRVPGTPPDIRSAQHLIDAQSRNGAGQTSVVEVLKKKQCWPVVRTYGAMLHREGVPIAQIVEQLMAHDIELSKNIGEPPHARKKIEDYVYKWLAKKKPGTPSPEPSAPRTAYGPPPAKPKGETAWDLQHSEREPGDEPTPSRISCITASQEEPSVIVWLIPYLIPIAKGSVVCGQPDMGKSTIVCDWIARGTRGRPWHHIENTVEPFDVIILSSEEDRNSDIIPRLMVAGADLDRVHFATATKVGEGATQSERNIALDTDIAEVEKLLHDYPHTRWIVVDPLAGYLGRVKKNDDEKIRAILDALKAVAVRNRVAVTCIDHFNKNILQEAIQRVSGAGSLTQVPRVVWGVVADKEDTENHSRLLLNIKGNNLSEKRKIGRKFTIEEVLFSIIKTREIAEIGQVRWGQETSTGINEVLQEAATFASPREKRIDRAAKFLREFLEKGPQQTEQVYAAAEKKNVSRGALWEASPKDDATARVKVRRYRASHTGPWYWEISTSNT